MIKMTVHKILVLLEGLLSQNASQIEGVYQLFIGLELLRVLVLMKNRAGVTHLMFSPAQHLEKPEHLK